MRYFVQIGREFPTARHFGVHNNTNPLFRIAWHFWPNTKYSGEVSLIISVDIHRESRLTRCVRTLIFSKCRTHWDFTLCPNSTVASTFNPMQYLQSLEVSKQISCVLRGIKRAIPRKLVKISDCRVSSFLKTVPGCRVSTIGDKMSWDTSPKTGLFYVLLTSKGANIAFLPHPLRAILYPCSSYL